MTTLPVIDVDTFSLSRSSAQKELYFPRKILKAEVDVNTYHSFIVVVVVDDEIYYWVYLSFDHLFQVYYKVRQLFLLQSATAFLLQSTTSVITKYNRYYKVWQFYYKVRRLLESTTVHKYTRLSDHLNKRSRWLTRINQSTYVVRTLRTQAFSSRVLLQTISTSLSGWKSQPPLQLIKQSLKQLITTELRAIFLLKKGVNS